MGGKQAGTGGGDNANVWALRCCCQACVASADGRACSPLLPSQEPVPASPEAGTGTCNDDADVEDEEEEGAPQQKQQGKAGRRRSGNGARSCDGAAPARLRRTVFGPLCLGAVGLMRGLRRLSITAAFGRKHTGLFGLAQLEHLTHLELRQAQESHKPVGLRGAGRVLQRHKVAGITWKAEL